MDIPAITAVILGLLAIFFVLRPVFWRGARLPEERPASPLEELRREKDGIYLAIREVEFDRRTEVVSEEDCRKLVARYRARAIELMQEIDRLEAEAGGAAGSGAPPETSGLPLGADPPRTPADAARHRCAGCGADNAEEHRFCIRCGLPLSPRGGGNAAPSGKAAP
jgi:hypothetical protein